MQILNHQSEPSHKLIDLYKHNMWENMVTGYLEVTTMPITIQHLTCNEVVRTLSVFGWHQSLQKLCDIYWNTSLPPVVQWHLLNMKPSLWILDHILQKINCSNQKSFILSNIFTSPTATPTAPFQCAYRRRRWRFIGDRATSSRGSHRWTQPRWWTCNCTWRCLLRRSRSRIAPQSSRMER